MRTTSGWAEGNVCRASSPLAQAKPARNPGLESSNSKPSNAKHLETAEILSQNISLYAWLSYKFPQIFVDAEHIPQFRKSVSRYIERALLTQKGYGDTQRENDLLKRITR